MIGYNNTVLKTTNAGENWIPQTPGNSDDNLSVFFLDESTGWIGTASGYIYKTTNGGDNWQQQLLVLNNWVTDICFVNESIGFAALHFYDPIPFNRSGAIIKTTNGGQSWSVKTQIFSAGFQTIQFVDELNGFAFGSVGVFTKTTDRGETWSDAYSITPYWIHTAFFVNENLGFAGAGGTGNDQIFRTTDKGNTWTAVRNTSENGAILGISFLDNHRGWACAYNGTILRTLNGGLNWEREVTGVPTAIGEIVIFDSTGFAVGENGKILKYSHHLQPNTIQLMVPNGGEVWEFGATEQILWNSSDIANVKIEWSSNNGSTWATVIDNYPSTGIFNWSIPTIQTNQGRVRISDASNVLNYASSTGTFRIIDITPVELISFEAKSINGSVVLNWSTATEVNNVGFEIERTDSELNSWSSLGFVEGNGTSTEIHNYTFIDTDLSKGKYSYRLKQIDFDGSINYSSIINIEINLPAEFKLYQNYPNPFNPSTKIKWQSPIAVWNTIKVYDILGNEVVVLVNEFKEAGEYEIEFSIEALNGKRSLASGIYYYRLEAGAYIETKKMLMIK